MSWVDVAFSHRWWTRIPTEAWFDTPWRNAKGWGKDSAAILWHLSDLPWNRRGVRRLGKALAGYHGSFTRSDLGQLHFLYFTDPRESPLSAHIGFGPAEGPRATTLRKHAHADSPDTIQPPETDEFASEHLGPGLRSLNHLALDDGTLAVNLWYAFRDEAHSVDVIMFASSEDIGRMVTALPAFDQLARGIKVFEDDEPGWWVEGT